jgi:hypothetical protein
VNAPEFYSAPAPELDQANPRKRRKKISFEEEMNQCFRRNCYCEAEREKTKTWAPQQFAMQKDDVTEAQEIATRLIEGEMSAKKSFCPLVWQ